MDQWRELIWGLRLEEAEIQDTAGTALSLDAKHISKQKIREVKGVCLRWADNKMCGKQRKESKVLLWSSISPLWKSTVWLLFFAFFFFFFFFAEPQKPSKTNGNKLKGECVYVCVCAWKGEEARDTRSAWGEWQAWIFNASRRRRGDGHQHVSPALDSFTAAALLAQLGRDEPPINWTGLSIQSFSSCAGLSLEMLLHSSKRWPAEIPPAAMHTHDSKAGTCMLTMQGFITLLPCQQSWVYLRVRG